jgi:hypothetical protein
MFLRVSALMGSTAQNLVSIDLHKKAIEVCVVKVAACGWRRLPRVRSYECVLSGRRAGVEENPGHPGSSTFDGAV